MGLFGKKKEKKRCDLCGSEMGLFSTHHLADGAICDACEKKLRGQFLQETNFSQSGMMQQEDPLERLDLEQARALIAKQEQEAAAALSELGGSYQNLFKADDAFSISPKPLEVGMKRAKLLKDRAVLRGMVLAGAFNQGDAVQLKRGESMTATTILELIPITTTSEFDTELGANSHKKTVAAGNGAWLILDVSGADARNGDLVVR